MAFFSRLTDRQRFAATLALTAAAYVAAGVATLPLRDAPAPFAPLFPAAGVALACVLMWGRVTLAAVALGAFVVARLGDTGGLAQPAGAWLAAAGIAFAATLQTAFGAALVRRWAPQPLVLASPRDVLGFFAAGTLACIAGAAVSIAVLLASWAIAPADAGPAAFTGWLGNMLGVLVAAPVVLTLIGRPRDAWVPRRLSVGLILAVTLLLLGLGIRQVARWSERRELAAFERDASNAVFVMTLQLQETLRALEATRGVFLVSDNVTREQMQRATQSWLAESNVQALGWAEPVRAEDVASFEARQRDEGAIGFHVTERGSVAASNMVIRFIDPVPENRYMLGGNVLSVAQTRAAVEATVASGRPAASAAFYLLPRFAAEKALGVIVYHAVFNGPSSSPAERRKNLKGVVFATLRMDSQIAGAASRLPPYLKVCIVDTDPKAEVRRLAGAPGCDTQEYARVSFNRLDFADRQWELRIAADRADVPGGHEDDTSLFAVIGLVASATLGGLLLTLSGRAQRIETAVHDRTAALESEVRDREVAEAALRESEQRFRSILDNVPIGMFYSDLRGNMIQTNPSLCALTGYSEAELLIRRAEDYTHPDDVAQDSVLMQQLLAGEIAHYRRHKRFISKAGATVWVQATVSLLRDAAGQSQRVVGVVEDITEHLRLEEAEQAREVAESSNRAKSDFLSRMSHELRTPLNAMLGFAQLLDLDQRHPLAEPQRPWVQQIQQAGWHLLEMINEVLDLSRIESGHVRLQVEALNVGDLLTASLSMVQAAASQRGVTISQDLAAGATEVMGDATRVKQVLTNLLSNAVKYNTEAGQIHVASRAAGTDRVEIVVRDTGLGMTPQQMAQLFQPFNRLGRERSPQEGTGIGLVISQRLAELMGGSLHARSVAGQGSSFILALPRVAEADTVRSDLDTLESVPADYHRRIVHYIEDNETNVEVMRGILAQRDQVQMDVSITGLDGLAAIRTRRPDLILLDMHLPDINGLELLRHIKADPKMSGIPVIVVSADALTEQIEAAFEAGAAHYLTKPISVAELLTVVDGQLGRAETRYG